ncbi:hypothetical protein GH714_034467 [Hevea brasiliensis]|uniref:NB-ARC domain-containing protein n=1 Tax=Hevea brasiliensis TaxID=3981 RepID=A0A6A6N651_HEVBR|nr:hypothetical protein GH714_034467 [Hevea brasiliensis]
MLGKASFSLAVDEGPSDIIEVEKSELLLEKHEPHPNLQHLTVEHFKDEVPCFWASPSITFFPSLQEIQLKHCTSLRGWWRRNGVELALSFKIDNEELQRFHFHAAVSISPSRAPLGTCQSKNLTSLQKLEILSCPKLASMSQDMGRLKCLQHLKIVDCDELISDDSDAMEWGDLGSLQSLNIRGLPKLTSPPKGLQFVTNLQELTIDNCASLMALQDWIGNLTSIRWLIISRLTSLPEGMHLLTSLQQLIIYECLKLSVKCIKEKGVDWPKIAHIPNLYTHPPGF